jgi:hypothetical protein
VEQRVKLLYYPVWQARYAYRGRDYEVAVDGVRGTVLRARAPREFDRAATVAVILLAVSAFCFGRPARALLLRGLAAGRPGGALVGALGAFAGLAIGGTVACLLAWIAWTAFRRSDELVLSEGETAQTAPESPELPEMLRLAIRALEWLFLPRGPVGGTG